MGPTHCRAGEEARVRHVRQHREPGDWRAIAKPLDRPSALRSPPGRLLHRWFGPLRTQPRRMLRRALSVRRVETRLARLLRHRISGLRKQLLGRHSHLPPRLRPDRRTTPAFDVVVAPALVKAEPSTDISTPAAAAAAAVTVTAAATAAAVARALGMAAAIAIVGARMRGEVRRHPLQRCKRIPLLLR